MTDDLERVMTAMRAAGWRSSEERLRQTAVKRLATAQRHQERAEASRKLARDITARFPEHKHRLLADGLRHEVQAAVRRGEISRPVRDIAFRLVLSWAGDVNDLLRMAEAIALPSAHLPPQPEGTRSTAATITDLSNGQQTVSP